MITKPLFRVFSQGDMVGCGSVGRWSQDRCRRAWIAGVASLSLPSTPVGSCAIDVIDIDPANAMTVVSSEVTTTRNCDDAPSSCNGYEAPPPTG